MSRPPCFSRCIFVFLLVLAVLSHFSHADVGTAARYRPPYIPTACNGRDPDQFPSGNLFGAAGEGIWDNGAACGRQYLVRCISATVARACIQGATIQIKIVDRALTSVSKPSRSDTTMVLSSTAFEKIANPSATYINVEYQQ
ncbi:EG45-like domain containing protein [Morella rubra]|uniref:EG45-like domain containing protein n=1 Tax=Morella rubra TaxID=262757 RepID=A0A6A1UXM8_9ROSI|nr:EG45-like domain containing protein [Morella rubra]KAB1204558.1 EG45-like domain containing protein [Morella rubra]